MTRVVALTDNAAAGAGHRLTQGGLVATVGLALAKWHYFRALDRNLRPGARLMEFGCGGVSSWIASRFRTIGLDLSMESAAVAGKVYIGGIQGDVSRLPFADRSFDAVSSSFVLEHLAPGIADRALSEIHRVLLPGGKLICLCDLECDHPMLGPLRHFWPDGYREAYVETPGHYGLVREDAWAHLLKARGFQIHSWHLVSRFPLLDHCPVVHLNSTRHFPAPFRLVGRLAKRVTRDPRVAPLWDASIVLVDSLTRWALPKSWAYRLLFVAQT
jgi:SAM-dependent methyltransferase